MKSPILKLILTNLKDENFSLVKLMLLICIVGFSGQISATTRNAATEADFNIAYTSSIAGDIINLTSNITFTSEKTISKTITINGNSYTLSVAASGRDDNGLAISGASSYRIFTVSSSYTLTINSLTMKGGAITTGYGAVIYVSTSAILYLNSCVLSNSSNLNLSGGALGNSGTVFLSKTRICRNSAKSGGGFINLASSSMFIENSSITENYTTTYGGGAGENQGLLYINNSTISNNQSLELGGGLNNYGSSSKTYILNSSVTGNVAYGGTNLKGGGIANNGGTVTAINTLFAYNYHISAGTSDSPTSYELDDVVAYTYQNQVNLYYCIYHAALPSGTINLGSIKYNGLQNGSDNSIFTGGLLEKITNSSGAEIGTASIFRPNLYKNNGIQAPTIKTGSFLLTNKGSQTRFANNANVSPVVAYYNLTTSQWVNAIGTSQTAQLVSTDQVNNARLNPPVIGTIEGITDNLVQLRVLTNTNGTTSGGNAYGEVYTSGSSITLTATPASNYGFAGWSYVVGGTGIASSANPYLLNLNSNIVLAPIFNTLSVSATTASVTKTANSTATVNVTSNTTWTASSDQAWLSVNSGTGNGTITCTALTANPLNVSRIATVAVKVNGVTDKTITVTQEAGDDALTLLTTSFTVGKSANSLGSIALTCTTSWTATADQSWLLVKSYGSGSDAISFMTTTDNPLAAVRQATITIKATGSIDKTIIVTQAAADATLSVSATSTSIAKAANSTATIDLTSNTIWTAASDQSWLTVASGGSGNQALTITATTANPFISTRTATVTIKATGVVDKTILVTQAAGDASLTLSSASTSVKKNTNSSANIDITSNTSWTATSSQSWLQVIAGATGNATITLTAINANPTVSVRSAIVTLKAVGVADKTITVNQDAGDPVLTASTNSVSIANNINSTATINVTSNTTWSATSSQSWLTFDSGFTGNGTLVLTTKTDNTSLSTRSAIVTLKASGATDISFEVIQEASLPTLSVSNTSVNIDPAASNTASININANTKWTAASDQSWLTLSSYSANNGTLTFFATNNTSETRLAVVTISATGVPDKKINVIQSAETTQNKYQMNMTITAIVTVNDNELKSSDLQLSIYIDDECRGSAKLQYVEAYKRYMAFIMVWGNMEDMNKSLRFKSLNLSNNDEHTAINGSLGFMPETIAGSPTSPYAIRFYQIVTATNPEKVDKPSVYPNPVKDVLYIDCQPSDIKELQLTDATGRQILGDTQFNKTEINTSHLAKGVYLLRIQCNGFVSAHQIIKK
ncbi:MAG: BACON domain-containing carbohydrate-binding protein [Paludibacter sp.]